MIESLLRRFRQLNFHVSGLPRVADILLGILTLIALLLTWLQWSTIYASIGALPPIAIAAVVSLVGGMAIAGRTRSPALSVPAGILILVLGCALWYGSGSRDLLGDLVGSWKSVASTGLLLPITQEFVLVPVITVWIAGWVAAEVITRRLSIELLIAPVIGAHVVSLAYTISQREPVWWVLALLGFILFTMLGISAADHHPDHAHTGGSIVDTDQTTVVRWRQALVALPFAGLVALLGVGFDRLVSEGSNDQLDLRERLVRPLDIFESTSPLSQVKAGLISPNPAEVFTIVVDELGTEDEIQLIPVATLDLYDGALWTSSARFEAAGSTLPAPDQTQLLDPAQLVQTVKIEDSYPFHFLPRVGQIAQTDSSFLGWDPRSGSIANVEASRSTFTYATRVRLPNPTPPTDAVLSQPIDRLKYATALPELNEEQKAIFRDLLDRVADGATTELEVLTQLEEYLASPEFAYNEEAPAGHSLAALTSYLVAPDDGSQSSIGFTEQSAATFAVATRRLGIPSRIVVGYRLPEPLTWDANRQTVSEDMIHAWPEVWFNNAGWVAFEPTNTSNETSEQTTRTPAVGDEASTAQASGLPELQAPILIPDPKVPGVARRRLAILFGVLALPILFVGGVLLAKGVRRSRRQRGDAAARISGAWMETRERLAAYGLPSSPSLTVIDIAEQLNEEGHMKVAVPLAKMAPTITSALFSPELPTDEQADNIWAEATTVRKEAAQVVPISRRLRAAADPRVLVRK